MCCISNDRKAWVFVLEMKPDMRHEPPNPREPLELPSLPGLLDQSSTISTVESVKLEAVRVSEADVSLIDGLLSILTVK
jgi:hypothetical protein